MKMIGCVIVEGAPLTNGQLKLIIFGMVLFSLLLPYFGRSNLKGDIKEKTAA